jgi:hypothetical protein
MWLHHHCDGPQVVAAAQRDDEFVAHLAPECAVLREAQVMGIRGLPAAAEQPIGND